MNKRTTARRKAAEQPSDPARHERLCSICSHPEREAIEEGFLHWRSPYTLEDEFDLPSVTTIYRHAHALGLFEQRRRNIRYALEYIIEDAAGAKTTSDGIIRAIRAYTSCLNDNGEWVEPVTTHRVIVSVARGDAHPPLPLLSLPASSLEGLPNGGSEALELPAAPSDQENDQEKPRRLIGNKVRIENAPTH